VASREARHYGGDVNFESTGTNFQTGGYSTQFSDATEDKHAT